MGQVVVGGLERGGVGVWGRVDRGGGKNQGGEVTRCENGGQTPINHFLLPRTWRATQQRLLYTPPAPPFATTF